MATQRIRVEAVKPGMKLAEEVRLANGQRLVAAGVVFDEALIQTLERRSIQTVCIENGTAAAAAPQQSPAELMRMQQEIQQRLLMRYAKVSQNPLMVSLFPYFQKIQFEIRRQS